MRMLHHPNIERAAAIYHDVSVWLLSAGYHKRSTGSCRDRSAAAAEVDRSIDLGGPGGIVGRNAAIQNASGAAAVSVPASPKVTVPPVKITVSAVATSVAH